MRTAILMTAVITVAGSLFPACSGLRAAGAEDEITFARVGGRQFTVNLPVDEPTDSTLLLRLRSHRATSLEVRTGGSRVGIAEFTSNTWSTASVQVPRRDLVAGNNAMTINLRGGGGASIDWIWLRPGDASQTSPRNALLRAASGVPAELLLPERAGLGSTFVVPPRSRVALTVAAGEHRSSLTVRLRSEGSLDSPIALAQHEVVARQRRSLSIPLEAFSGQLVKLELIAGSAPIAISVIVFASRPSMMERSPTMMSTSADLSGRSSNEG